MSSVDKSGEVPAAMAAETLPAPNDLPAQKPDPSTPAPPAPTPPPAPRPALLRLLIPGTDADVIASYSTLAERARDAVFGAFEDDVIILDVETTGLSPERDVIIEIAAARQRGPQIIDTFNTFVNPGRPIPLQITELTSITDADVADAPDIATALQQLADFIQYTSIIAHNCEFDRAMLRASAKAANKTQQHAFINKNAWVDSIELARISLTRCKSHGLQSLTAAFCDARSTHRAIDDVIGLAQLWRILLVALSDFPPGLVRYISELYAATDWPLRPYFTQVAGSLPDAGRGRFSLLDARRNRSRQRPKQDKQDALELFGGRGTFHQIDNDELAAAYRPEGLLGQMYANYELRQEQVDMAVAVAEALNNSSHLVVEAGTGVGKSIAYLLPLAEFAQRNDICCGVATKTNALLDQLLYSELPRLAERLPDGLVFEALKGYDHYPCLRKLASLARNQDRQLRPGGVTMCAALLAFVCQSSRGDLDHLRLRFDDISRFEVVANADDCLKRKCRYYQHCLLHGARRSAAEADIVITNQALLFCDIMAEGGILPPIRHWVIDEAHGVEDEARDQLSLEISGRELSAAIDALISRRGALANLKEQALPLPGGLAICGRIDAALLEAAAAPTISRSFESDLKELIHLAESSSYDQVDLWINQEVRNSRFWADLSNTGSALSRRLDKLWQDCRDICSLANEFEELSEAQADLAGLTADLGQSLKSLYKILDGEDSDYVYSASLDRRVEQNNDSLTAARIDVGEVLSTQLFPNTLSVIFTSATLATGSSFDYFARSSGLSYLPAGSWRSLQLASSYDFEHNMAIYLPNDLPEPNAYGYRDALEELLYQVHLALGGSVLTLFTNRREMETLYDRLRGRLDDAGIRLLCQWRGTSKRRLAEDFLENRELSLFALRSFWQGFDAPGDTLRCVIIPKLPFNRPTDPLARERSLRERDSWRRYTLPEAIIDLRQAAGRLIRSSTDRGALILADSRLLTKSYGPTILEALPGSRRLVLNTESIAASLSQSGL